MPIWKPTSVEVEPVTSLVRWQVIEVDGKGRHFVGHAIGHFGGRASSAIQEFDPTTRQGRTRSGRVYKLIGPPGIDGDAQYVWAQWCRINAVESERNVSMEYDEAPSITPPEKIRTDAP